MTNRHVAIRWAAIVAIIHAGVVTVASMVYSFLLGREISWAAARFLRVVDWPVYWAIERTGSELAAMLLEEGYRLPASWPLGAIWTSVLIQSFSHAVIGGALYALLAATLAYALHRNRLRRREGRGG